MAAPVRISVRAEDGATSVDDPLLVSSQDNEEQSGVNANLMVYVL